MATPRKSAASKAKETSSPKAAKRPVSGHVVEELDNDTVAVFPALKKGNSGDYAQLAAELIAAADNPSEVQTRTMPKRFIIPARVAKAAGLI